MKNILTLFTLFFISISCTKNSTNREEDEILKNPTKPKLIWPINNEPCFDGVSLNDTQSQIDFQWIPSIYTSNYSLIITNLSNNSTQEFQVTNSHHRVTLNKEEPFVWKVISYGVPGTIASESDPWKFYLAGDSVTNFAPFPSELINPQSASTVTPNNDGEITLVWIASDVDGDLASHTVYMDTVDATTEITQISAENTTQHNVVVTSNETYFWRVVTLDQSGNSSDSGTYAFRVN